MVELEKPRFKIGQTFILKDGVTPDVEALIIEIKQDVNGHTCYVYKFTKHDDPKHFGGTKEMPFDIVDMVAEFKPMPFTSYWREINA